jgi:hypothetical protein
VTQVLDFPKVDDAAVAVALEVLRDRGATCQAYIRAGGTNVCVKAVYAGGDRWSEYREAASRRAATRGRRMLPVLDSGDVEGRFWIAYDVGTARSLADHRGRPILPTSTSQRVLSDVARALDEAAAQGVFASELPPASVFVTGKGARLGDLGTAREGLAGARLELEGDPAWVPPEVLRGERAGERSGVYLFGALLHYLLTGAAPRRNGSSPRECRQLDLPASIKAIVARTMADDPGHRPHAVSEAHGMAQRALRGEPQARARKRRTATAGRAKRAISPATTAKRAFRKAARARRAIPKLDAARPLRRVAKLDAARPLRRFPKLDAARPLRRVAELDAARPLRRVAAVPVTRRRVLGVGGALALGAAAGLLLGTSPDPEPARAQTVTAGGLSVTLPSARHRVEPRPKGLAVRAPGSLLRARLVDSPLLPATDARPVQLGRLQAWRHSAGGEVHYSVPTSRGTLAVTCRVTASASSRPLRLCERTASTLRLREARALPLAAVAEEARRLRATVAALEAERDAGRARLAGAFTPNDQHVAAQDLADSHESAATALRELTGAGPVEAAARAAADAYARLAAAAESGSAERWTAASERVRRSDAVLVQAISAAH